MTLLGLAELQPSCVVSTQWWGQL